VFGFTLVYVASRFNFIFHFRNYSGYTGYENIRMQLNEESEINSAYYKRTRRYTTIDNNYNIEFLSQNNDQPNINNNAYNPMWSNTFNNSTANEATNTAKLQIDKVSRLLQRLGQRLSEHTLHLHKKEIKHKTLIVLQK
jgi:hypothetical protein